MGFLDKFKKKKASPARTQKEGVAPETEEYTPGGSAVYRYKTPENQGFRPPEDVCVSMEAVEKHMEEIFPGGESFVYHEILSDLVHIDVHVLRGPREEDGAVLYTTGMSDLPMSLPEEIADREDLKYAELYMILPGGWDLGREGSNPKDLPYERFWPIQMLKFLARFPHEYKTWLGWGHSIPNGPDYAPVCEGVGFGGAVLAQPTLVPPLETEEGKKISFYMVIPAYKEEIEYKLKYGMEGLDQRFAEGKLPMMLDVHRPNLCADFKEILD
ncbi:MAG: suppressor of fused domain protein [Oscillibacter sp.]|nr:suppressor of fused domain protein [Oscillibacter sp.]